MSTIVELINERAAKIMEEGGTTEKVINVKNISKSDAIEMAIEQLVKEGLIKAPTMTAAERRERLAKARRKTGVFSPKQEPPKAETKQEPTAKVEPEAKTETKPAPKDKKPGKITLADLYKFVSEDKSRPIFNGVYFADGIASATDASILIQTLFDYPKENEGKVITKIGAVIEGKYPDFKSVTPDISDGFKPIKINPQKLVEYCNDLITLGKGFGHNNEGALAQHFAIRIGKVHFSPYYIKTIAQICDKLGIDEIWIKDNTKAAIVKIDNGIMLLMPLYNSSNSLFYIDTNGNMAYQKAYFFDFDEAPEKFLEKGIEEDMKTTATYMIENDERHYKMGQSRIKKQQAALDVLKKYNPADLSKEDAKAAQTKRRQLLAKARAKMGVTNKTSITPDKAKQLKLFKDKPEPPKPTPDDDKTRRRRERLASIRAKRGATAKGKVNLTGVHLAKAKDTTADLDFLPANLRGKKIPTGGDYDDFARKAMNETIGDPAVFIWQYTKGPYWYSFSSDYPEQNKDLTEILRLTEAHKKGHDIDSEGRLITNVIDINGNRVREGDWVRVSGSWSEAENRMYRVQKLEGGYIDSKLMQFGMVPINQDGTDAKSAAFNIWPFWNSGHSKSEDREAYHKHNKENLKIEILPKQPKEIKVTERYRATKDGIYLPDKTYVPVYYYNGTKDGEPIEVRAREYDGNLSFLQTETDIVENNSDSMTDYFEKDRITVTKDNPLYDIVRLGALKNLLANLGIAKKSTVGIYERSVRRAEEAFNATRSPQASITLLEEQKRLKAAQKEYEEEMNKGEGLKREIERLNRKLKGESKTEKKIVEKVDIEETVYPEPDEKTLKRRERLASIRAKQGATKATKPKGTPRKPKAATEPDEKTIARRERLAAIRARAGARKAESAKGRTFKRVAPAAEPKMSHDERVSSIISSHPISESAARDAKRMMSFDSYKAGSASRDFAESIREVAQYIENWPEERHGEFYRLLNRYARNFSTYINRDNAIGSRVPSVMISGAGNFPVRKKQKQIAAWDSNHKYYNDKVEPLISRLKYPSRQGIKSGDKDALTKLQAKLDRMQENQELMKRANADFAKALKEKKTVGQFLEQVSYLSDDMRKDAMFNIQSWHGKPFPPYALQNANQEMRRLKQRIADISKVKEEGSGEVEKYKNDHFTVERDTDIMRYKLIFDGVPAKEVRDVIKKNGAHWSPHYVAWLLPLTGTSGYKIESIIQELDKLKE